MYKSDVQPRGALKELLKLENAKKLSFTSPCPLTSVAPDSMDQTTRETYYQTQEQETER